MNRRSFLRTTGLALAGVAFLRVQDPEPDLSYDYDDYTYDLYVGSEEPWLVAKDLSWDDLQRRTSRTSAKRRGFLEAS